MTNPHISTTPAMVEAVAKAICNCGHTLDRYTNAHPELRDYWRRQAGVAISAVQSSIPADEWQPIETAPKDGAWIDAIGGPWRQNVRWNGVYWESMSGGFNLSDPMAETATHWRPLPAPPGAVSHSSIPVEELKAEVIEAARLFLKEGTRVTQRGDGYFFQQVIEKKDKSDPHYKLCVAVENLDHALSRLNTQSGERG